MTAATEVPESEAPGPTEREAPLAGNLNWLLSQASHALATETAARLDRIGFAPRGYCVLKSALEGKLTQKEIARASGLDKTTMVVTLDQLEAAGLAKRLPSETDRRARVVAVTAAGRRKLGEAERVVAEIQAEILATLPAGERRALIGALDRLVSDRLSAPTECGGAVRRRD